MKICLLHIVACAFLLANCRAMPTAEPTATATAAATSVSSATHAPTAVHAVVHTATSNALGLNIVAAFDATRQVLTIYGTTPGATIVYAGAPLALPYSTATSTPPPTGTPALTNTPAPRVSTPQPRSAPAIQITAAALHGKIMLKSARGGGSYPNEFSYYVMDPDGTNVQSLESKAASSLYLSLQSREGFSPDNSRVVLGERNCKGGGSTCALYILDTTLDAGLIYSNNDIGHGVWFINKGFEAKDPAWSPAGNYIAFASNHEQGQGCVRTTNIFKGTPTQNPTVRRLTQFCSASDGGHPSFSPDGSQLAFWSEDTGLKQVYILDVSADNNQDYRSSNPRLVGDGQSDDWDPLWVK